jgi:uncharacterized membrane protein
MTQNSNNSLSKRKMMELRRKSKYHNNELQKLNKNESKILKDEGFEHKSNKLIWLLVIITIIVAVVWFILFR